MLRLENKKHKKYIEVETFPEGVEIGVNSEGPQTYTEQHIALSWDDAIKLAHYILDAQNKNDRPLP